MWKKSKLDKEIIKYIGLISQLGLIIITSILIFLSLFIFLDKTLKTNGILIPVGVVTGVICGVFADYKILKRSFLDHL